MVLIQLWGAASAALVVAILFATFQTWVPAEAIRSSSSSPSPLLVSHGGFLSPSTLPSFKEAPCFNNQNSSDCFPSPDEAFVCDPISVHIAMTLDAAYLRGSMAAVFSILKHASCPSNVVFHFLVCEREHEFATLLRSTFPNLNLKTYFFNETLVRERISSSVRQALEQPLNYARNYLADILEPCVRRVIYLDSDVVVVDDITKLWSTRLAPDTAIGAPEYCHANFSKYFTPVFWSDPVLSSTFRGRSPCYFNTGVMIMELEKWRAQGYTSTIEKWMEIQKERRIYELGSLPPFLLVFAGKVEPVEHRWNQHGLGGDFVKGSCRPLHSGPVSLLHWSGNGKPWLRLDSGHPCPLDSLWAPYDLYLPQSSLSS